MAFFFLATVLNSRLPLTLAILSLTLETFYSSQLSVQMSFSPVTSAPTTSYACPTLGMNPSYGDECFVGAAAGFQPDEVRH